MLIALIILNVVHPGRLMNSKESDIPGRKERKGGKVCRVVDSEESGEMGEFDY